MVCIIVEQAVQATQDPEQKRLVVVVLQQLCSVESSVDHAYRSLLCMANNAVSSSNKGTYLLVRDALDAKQVNCANTEERSRQYAERWRLGLSQPHTDSSADLLVSY